MKATSDGQAGGMDNAHESDPRILDIVEDTSLQHREHRGSRGQQKLFHLADIF